MARPAPSPGGNPALVLPDAALDDWLARLQPEALTHRTVVDRAALRAAILRCHDDPLDGCISAHRLLRAVVDTGAAKVMVLPNGYVAVEELVAACTAAIGWGIDVVPLPTGSMATVAVACAPFFGPALRRSGCAELPAER
mgnify:CR=1 FL=1